MEYVDRFGSERADDDYARGDNYKEMFLETAAVKDFLTREPGYRYVLGTMGAGKSILLIKLREHVESNQKGAILAPTTGIRVYTPSAEFASSVHWAPFWRLERHGQQDITAWTQLWEWGLLRCVLFHWAGWAKSNDSPHAARTAELLASSLGGEVGADPFTAIATFVGRGGAGSLPDGIPHLPATANLREFVEQHRNDFPPTYLFLDSQDDFFQESPAFWTASTLGCKYAVDQVVRRSNHRIHVVMTLRPEILWRSRTDADAMRFRGDMFRLEWTKDQVIGMLAKRAECLKDSHLLIPPLRRSNPMAAFFGPAFYGNDDIGMNRPQVQNHSVGNNGPVTEPLEQYLYRHSLGRPREMILIGNHILDERVRSSAAELYGQAVVRDAVAKAAHAIALAYIGEIKQRWSWRSESDHSAEAALKRFLRDHVKRNVLDDDDIRIAERDYLETCGQPGTEDATPFSVLASAGLIGWLQADRDNSERFFQFFPQAGAPEALGQTIPKTVRKVFVHPILYGAEFAIECLKGLVVGPFVRVSRASAAEMKLI